MTHRFPIKEIARQAALGTATVDRALNGRAHVSAQTQGRVQAAIAELAAQEGQLSARGRRLFFDVIVDAPTRFSHEVRDASQAVLPHIATAVCRPRFLLQDIMDEAQVTSALARVLKRGSHGVCLKARDTPRIRAAVNRLVAAKIPVVTLVTDIAGTNRLAYVGLDNAGAGRTAAFLIARTIGTQGGTILATRSHAAFLGEEERAASFTTTLAHLRPDLEILAVNGGGGAALDITRLLDQAHPQMHALRGVYSMGGGNRSILRFLDHHRLRPQVFVGHDLDRENRTLIADGRIDFLLHHDLHTDMRAAFTTFMRFHNLPADPAPQAASTVQIITPENIPINTQQARITAP